MLAISLMFFYKDYGKSSLFHPDFLLAARNATVAEMPGVAST